MTDDQQQALERVRDTCAVLRSFLHTTRTGVPAPVWHATYGQLTGDLQDAAEAAHRAGIPHGVIFANM
ncbi:MAG: hypothetical protein EOP30_04510 [Rhodococcus sp. (in: high G+C Gram-positive bacteria)]|nr:MAG: hypothetical protein EOP30_04510 [Rhodococcus sp. (in: high G+C Gram-positive bacteria)]